MATRRSRLHFFDGQLFNPDTGEVWARNVSEEHGPRLAAFADLCNALREAVDEAEDCTKESGVRSKPHFDWQDIARAALRKADGHAS